MGGSDEGWVLGGRYRVIDRVGAGGMAEVFRAHDQLLDRDVAVKVFRTAVEDPDATLNAANRRELELQAMARLNHPNLVTLFDGSVAGEGPAYLVLEYVDGPNLAARLADGPLPEPQARELGAQIADGLAYVHAHGLVHRDVKPANILLGSEDGAGRARLSDFGVVRMVGRPQMTSAELTIGTAYYLAPEQARGSAVGPEADVYALGLVLLEALTGHRAFDGPMHEALAARLNADPAVPENLPEPWPNLLRAMTAREPSSRPDAATVARELRGFAATGAYLAAGGMATGPLIAAAAVTGPLSALAPSDPALPAALAAPAIAAGAAPRRTRRRHLTPVLLLAAMVLAGAAVIGAFLLTGKSPSGTPAGTQSTLTPSTHHTSAPKHRTSSSAAQVVNAPATTHHSSTKAKHSTPASRKSSVPAPVGGAPSTSAPAPSASSTTSAPPSSSPAPSTSAPVSGAATTQAVANGAPTTSAPAGG